VANRKVKVYRNTYLDSVLQMAGTRVMLEHDGVEWAAGAMATPANVDTLVEKGFERDELDGAGANDLFLAVVAGDEEAAAEALAAAEERLFQAKAPGGPSAGGSDRRPRTLEEGLELQPGTDVAIISVPGDYAALEAHKALTAGLHTLLFSDNVSVGDEVELKDRATELGRLVMGPGAGTAMLGGTGLGFANVVKPGRVGVIAAAGTGAQEAMSLLDRWGVGVSHVIGLGGRDLTDAIDGRMAKLAVAAMRADEGTDAVLLVSKPPSERVAQDVVRLAGDMPLVASLVGLKGAIDLPEGVTVVTTLEAGVVAMLRLLGRDLPDLTEGVTEAVDEACARVPPGRTRVRGLFSGGTLCYESLVILSDLLGPVWSNTPLDKRYKVPAPAGSHVCLDLGEEEYTKGRPHPMIDPQARLEFIREAGGERDVAVILVDVVLGYGSHPDPASELAPAVKEIRAEGGPEVVAYVLGTDQDPQGLARQRATLVDAGCIVTPTAARASLAAAAIALRRPELVAATL
jgi:FdrA protein